MTLENVKRWLAEYLQFTEHVLQKTLTTFLLSIPDDFGLAVGNL